MPRGIPKDPNHPRNKKQDTAPAATEPKRRGRPPGSGAGKKNAVAVASKAPLLKEAVLHKEISKGSKQLVGTTDSVDVSYKSVIALSMVRENIKLLNESASNGGSEVQEALIGQVKEMIRLTDEILHPNDEVEDSAPVVATQAPVVVAPPALAVVPQQQVPNNLPTPPSFVPPPFPPQS